MVRPRGATAAPTGARGGAPTADVIALPRRGAASADGPPTATSRPTAGVGNDDPWDVDEWGRDRTVTGLCSRLLGLRWNVEIGGTERLDEATDSGRAAVVVVNSSTWMLTPWFVALALDASVDRPVRFVGRPDTAPIGAVARRLGGLLDHRDDIAGAVADGDLLVIGTTPTIAASNVGEIAATMLEPIVEQRVATFPAAVSVARFGRAARIEIGAAVPAPDRRGPLGAHEFAATLRTGLATLIESSGRSATGSLLDWLPSGWRAR